MKKFAVVFIFSALLLEIVYFSLKSTPASEFDKIRAAVENRDFQQAYLLQKELGRHFPDSSMAGAAPEFIISFEIRELSRKSYQQALELLARRKSEFPGLSPNLEIEIRLAQIEDAVHQGSFDEPRLQYAGLLKEFPESLAIHSSILKTLPGEWDPASPLNSINNALFIAEHTSGILDPVPGNVLSDALYKPYRFKELAGRLVPILAFRYPGALDRCRENLNSRSTDLRIPSYLVLKTRNVLSESEIAGYHYRNLLSLEFSKGSLEIRTAVDYFKSAVKRSDWEDFKKTFAACSTDTVESIIPFDSTEDPETEVPRLMATCFFPEQKKTLLHYFTQPTEPKWRLDALKALQIAGCQDLDLFQFHRTNLTFFDPLCKNCAIRNYFKLHKLSVDFFGSQKNGPESAEALKSLMSGRTFLMKLMNTLDSEYSGSAEAALSHLNSAIKDFKDRNN
ncbi:MAG: hypothetical protein PHW04_11325 [Candidatus Wallbacteria bacterium]|nr:hypothetical protein [Candidatus Wallbacteria bacterium]